MWEEAASENVRLGTDNSAGGGIHRTAVASPPSELSISRVPLVMSFVTTAGEVHWLHVSY